MNNYDAPGPADSDLWHVQLANGEVCTMTLELLDDAYQDGIISEQTYVWQEGSSDWITLGEIAGLDADDSEAVALMSPSPWPATVIAPTYPSGRMGPRELASPYSPSPYSTAPVAGDISDIDFDLESVTFRPRKRSKMGWIVAAAFIAAIGVGTAKRDELAARYRGYLPPAIAARLAAASKFTTSLAAAPTPPAPAQVAAPPAPTPPAPTPLATITQPTPTTAVDSRFSEDQKRALSNADKALTAKQQQKQKHRAAAPSSPRRVKSENPFHKGGDSSDPLNASL